MKTNARVSISRRVVRRLTSILVVVLTLLARLAFAAPGEVDPTFNANLLTTAVRAMAVQADGKILIAGDFTSVAGTPRNYLARLHPDGALDPGFNPVISGFSSSGVYTVAVQADQKIVIGGSFTTVSGTARAQLARLDANGALDTGFAPSLSDDVSCLAVQSDGRILIGGTYHLKRLNTNGTLDGTFNNAIHGTGFYYINAIAAQPDGKIVVGSFADGIIRLNANGSTDAAFNPNANSSAYKIVVQPDGKILAAGYFSTIGGTARNGFARLNANGTLDTAFNPAPDSSVFDVALQADGKMLVGGSFTSIGGAPRSNAARLSANGTLDATFLANLNGAVGSLAMQADGKVFINGSFGSVGGLTRNQLARLGNDAATQSLTVPGPTRVEWLRGGASPEVGQVIFELSTNGGNSFTALGSGTRIAGGWERSGLSLPAAGEIRARGRTGAGVLGNFASFGAAAPEIAVEQPAGTDLADGGSVSFGSVGIGDGGTSRTFTIKNTGTASLTGLAITLDGPDQALFAITASPNQPVPGGGSTTFSVRFTPTATGARTASLHIASNDSDENSFDITLIGTGALSTNADLSALTMSAGGFVPSFASGTTSYATSVTSQMDSVTFTPITASTAATVKINGVTVAPGSASAPIALSAGANVITTTVTAGDGVSTKTYTVTLTRPAPGSGAGDLDAAFDAGIVFNPGGGDAVSALAEQADGKIVFGGKFTSVAGTTRNNLARLHADGTLDAAFNPNADAVVSSVIVQPDGKIVIGGRFTSIAGNARSYLARLNADGTLDTGFNPNSNGLISSMALQADGKILVAGLFSSVGGSARSQLARLNTDGTADSAFNPSVNSMVLAVAVQDDGKIVIGGSFFAVNAVTRNYIARLNADGTLDTGFDPNAGNSVYCVALQPDGKILFGGSFNSVAGIARRLMARVHADGTLDGAFDPDVGNGFVYSLAVQADGKVVLGGAFSRMDVVTRRYLARVHADGTLDSAFNPGVTILGYVNGVALQADGRVLVGGEIYSVGGAERFGLARLLNDPANQTLTIASASRVDWLRGGARRKSSR